MTRSAKGGTVCVLERTLNRTCWPQSALNHLCDQNYTPNLYEPYMPLKDGIFECDM